MEVIPIAQNLWFEEDPRGATLTCQAGEGEEATYFHVGISHQSLLEMNSALATSTPNWIIRDGSLLVEGDKEELTLHFCARQGPAVEAELSLFGLELKAFRWAINAFALRRSALLN